MKELVVWSNDPAALDRIVNQFGAFVGQNPDGSYRADSKGNYAIRHPGGGLDFIGFMLKEQGYAKIIEEREI